MKCLFLYAAVTAMFLAGAGMARGGELGSGAGLFPDLGLLLPLQDGEEEDDPVLSDEEYERRRGLWHHALKNRRKLSKEEFQKRKLLWREAKAWQRGIPEVAPAPNPFVPDTHGNPIKGALPADDSPSEKSGVIAVLASLLFPGLGHLYMWTPGSIVGGIIHLVFEIPTIAGFALTIDASGSRFAAIPAIIGSISGILHRLICMCFAGAWCSQINKARRKATRVGFSPYYLPNPDGSHEVGACMSLKF